MRPVGQPTKFTAERRTRILQALRAGNHLEPAAQYGGVHYDTFNNWILRGRELLQQDDEALWTDEDREYVEFAEAVQATRAEAEVEAVSIIRKAMYQDWRPAMAWLQFSFPDRWGRRWARMELTGKDGGPIEVAEFSDAERVRRFRALCELLPQAE